MLRRFFYVAWREGTIPNVYVLFSMQCCILLVVRWRRRPHPSAESIAEKIQSVRHSCRNHATIISDEIHLLDRRGSMLKSRNTRPGHRLKRRGKYCMIGLSTMCPKIISYTETCHMVHLSRYLSLSLKLRLVS